MKKRPNLYLVLWIVIVLVVLMLVGIKIAVLAIYGDKPVGEIPLWALLFIWGGRN